MAEASRTVEMSVSADKFWKAISEYEKYPEFVEGVHSVKVLSRENNVTRAEYKINLLSKDITYTLDHMEKAPNEMTWKFVDSNIFKDNTGGWTIKSLGADKIEVTYRLGLEFKIYVPGMILSGLVKSTLPSMMSSFEKRAKAATRSAQ